VHQITCPRIKRIEYNNNGTIRSIELHPPQAVTICGTKLSSEDLYQMQRGK
jgi:hypothetical protein